MRQSFRRLFLVPLLAAGILLSGASPAFAASAAPVLSLTAMPNPSGNYVALNWTNSDKNQPYSYMLYSKSAHESTFQSIPAKDSAKVLNIYPIVAPTVSFTTWQGKNYTLPKSASLKMWMETSNEYDPKGYGKGLISVDTVSIADFNANPDTYLKNADGSYKYDVLYFGAWDAFASQDLSAAAETKADAFIKTGRGVLFGHDTMVDNDRISMPNFFELAHYCNIQTIPKYTILGGTQITVAKKGLLTNYPWKIGNVGTVLNVPMSHSNQLAFGDVWMTYQQPYTYSGSTEANGTNGQGTNTFYLTSWSNCAMIQTGHSDGEATPDEQRVTANTLFYLAQITTDTSWNDHKGQDLDAPDEPAISGVTHNFGRTQYTVNYSSQDNATGYQYYVEATGQNDGVKYDSPVISTSLKTGMKGYSIVVDNNPDTVPDGSITTTSSSYTFPRPSGSSFYIHIAAVDNAGNISAVTHYHTDELVSVTHPISIGYSIDPNSDTPFTAPDIPITNHSTFPIKVSVAGLKAISGIGDAAPTSFSDWNSLTAAQTGSRIALGVGISKTTGSGWTAVDRESPVYTGDLVSEVPLGTLGANGASGNLALTAKFGLAWANAKTVSHELTLDFTIAD
ncbi:hypothetical protein CAFE_21230 [Caprobacter fermentans]|uniref:Uncharacterized protein n=1 Tax=Caproicibacter fermentans TaxID=2576756 RepID=A0A6N8I0G6_9FIRM|nr:DUF5057 domain-containing protein [Caproicibacter fermentans]MVB11408.1 hypothetical protein [Caproicibacter fermentans]